MVWYTNKGIPVRSAGSLYGKGTTPTTLIRIPVNVKQQLDEVKQGLQRDNWAYVSYGDTISHLLKLLIK